MYVADCCDGVLLSPAIMAADFHLCCRQIDIAVSLGNCLYFLSVFEEVWRK